MGFIHYFDFEWILFFTVHYVDVDVDADVDVDLVVDVRCGR